MKAKFRDAYYYDAIRFVFSHRFTQMNADRFRYKKVTDTFIFLIHHSMLDVGRWAFDVQG